VTDEAAPGSAYAGYGRPVTLPTVTFTRTDRSDGRCFSGSPCQ
jgi:hypothetical protein